MGESDPAPPKKTYHGFGRRLVHDIPFWARDDAVFHLRVRCAPGSPPLTHPDTARALLDSVRLYHERRRWCVHLFLLMPDHWHALLSFPSDVAMSRVLGDWKKYHTKHLGLLWQDGYFDHRLRNHLDQYEAVFTYIRRNPLAKNLCPTEDAWPWQWRAPDIEPDTRPESGHR